MKSGDYVRELKRKVFHCLSLVYLAAFHLLGRWDSAWILAGWILVEGTVEALRLHHPRFNEALMKVFGGIHRPSEEGRVSGVFWTSLGCLAAIVLFGDHPKAVTAGFLFLALGDGSAALVGKAVGRIRIGFQGRTKTLEGSAACLFVCLAAGWAAGFTGLGLVAGATTATLVELLPVPIDDNFWLPVLSAAVLSLF